MGAVEGIVVKEENGFKYIEQGEGPVLVLLHGLFGALSNFSHLINEFSGNYKVVVPMLPLYELPVLDSKITTLVKHVVKFVDFKKYGKISLLGNSLGGHVALLYTLERQHMMSALILTASSGLYEQSLGATFPKRGNYDFIKEKTEYTFYDPKTATKELVDETFEIVNNRNKAIRIIQFARNALKHNVGKDLPKIKIPTLLIWGKNDTITPPHVAEEFQKLMGDADLEWIDKCGHAPMMERPLIFNKLLGNWLKKKRIVSNDSSGNDHRLDPATQSI